MVEEGREKRKGETPISADGEKQEDRTGEVRSGHHEERGGGYRSYSTITPKRKKSVRGPKNAADEMEGDKLLRGRGGPFRDSHHG